MARAPSKRADLLFEIGTEEIPARFLPSARRQLAALAERELVNIEGLATEAFEAHATPRRLVLIARGVAERQVDRTVTQPGPFRSQGFDAAGKPTAAAEGFARKYGVAVADLKEIADPKGPRLAYVVTKKGKIAREVLPGVLERVLRGFEFPKGMRWPGGPAPFARPIRWLLALHGTTALKLAWGRVGSGKATRGRRFVHPKPLPVASASAYPAVLRKAGILVEDRARKALIKKEAERLAAKAGGTVLWNEELLDEVSNLVEAPVAVIGSFPADALEVPEPVLVAAMEEHQRYFPVKGKDGKLLPRFITIANSVATPKVDATTEVVAGNERVLKARLADARFFYKEDRKRPLADFAGRLDSVVWQAGAGSMADKTKRLSILAQWLAGHLGEDAAVVKRAAELCKADLTTQMVGEFPMLQGVAGGLYAGTDGEGGAVAAAIRDHYRPAGPGDELPETGPGCALALADKLDQLAGHFGLGHAPSGSADPFGLRRAALGVVRVLQERGWRLSLRESLERAAGGFAVLLPAFKAEEARRAVLAFLRTRVDGIFEEQGFAHDEIQAALVGFDDVVQATGRMKALAVLKTTRKDFRDVALALSRVTNILPKGYHGDGTVAAETLQGEERTLFDAHEAVSARASDLAEAGKFEELFDVLASLKPAIDSFFAAVLVMDPDAAVKERRLALLKRVERTIRLFADVKALVLN